MQVPSAGIVIARAKAIANSRHGPIELVVVKLSVVHGLPFYHLHWHGTLELVPGNVKRVELSPIANGSW
jgi:hypothetical protein